MEISEKANRRVRLWLWCGAGLILLMMIIGGITRLSGAGLSMTDWNLLLGAVPPMNEAEWLSKFADYKQFPEYLELNRGMSLSEFKAIFFWEYLHRLIGRVIGLVFLVPFSWFWYRGYFTRDQIKKVAYLFILGALQGGMGWFMVKSGLVDMPHVSHFRLAAHLLLAFLLFGYCVWLALDFNDRGDAARDEPLAGARNLRYWLLALAVLLIVQVSWGALVAGLDAGYIYNTFPMMNQAWWPVNGWLLTPGILNLVENPGTVQWVHRILGTLLALAAILLWIKTYFEPVDGYIRNRVSLFLFMILLQYLLGVVTLIYHVPISLGVAHQALAMIIWGAWIGIYHPLRG